MSEVVTNTPAPGGPWAAVARFLKQYPTESRAQALHSALQSLRARVEPDRVLACELAWEMHAHGYWSQIRRPDGGAYESEEAYFRDVLGLASWRTAYKRLAIGRMLMGFEEPERSQLRAAIAAVGLAKATVVVPAIERLREWKPWLEWAGQLPSVALQEKVSAALEALPRGREPSPPGSASGAWCWRRCPISRPWSSWTGSLRSGPRSSGPRTRSGSSSPAAGSASASGRSRPPDGPAQPAPRTSSLLSGPVAHVGKRRERMARPVRRNRVCPRGQTGGRRRC